MDESVSPESLERLRVLACDLAEHWVERVGRERGFAVWERDADVQSFTDDAQALFDGASDAIEREFIAYVEGTSEDVVVAALADYGDRDVVLRVLHRL